VVFSPELIFVHPSRKVSQDMKICGHCNTRDVLLKTLWNEAFFSKAIYEMKGQEEELGQTKKMNRV
jgi:hypothetical protein